MSSSLPSAAALSLLLSGCGSGEVDLINITDSVTIDVTADEGDTIAFVALLAWEGDALPRNHVSDALRLGVVSDLPDAELSLEYLRVDPANVSGFANQPEDLNLFEVFERCGTRRCERVVDILVTREEALDESLTLSGDAIYTTRRARWRGVNASLRLLAAD